VNNSKQYAEKTLKDVTEKGLLSYLKKYLSKTNKFAHNVVVDIGDDCFVGKIPPNRYLVITSDAFVEDVHFSFCWCKPENLGYKLLAANISDLSSMGNVEPSYGILCIGCKGTFPFNTFRRIYSGLVKIANRYNIKLIGGDTVRAEKLFLSFTLVGFVKKNEYVTRSSACVGDKIFHLGYLGLSGAGLEVLKSNPILNKTIYRKYRSLIAAHLKPKVYLHEGQILGKYRLATACIDTSDGLYRSIKFLTEASNTGAVIHLDKIPLHRELVLFSKEYKTNVYDYILYGGEDYGLLFTANEDNIDKLHKFFPKIKHIGEIVSKKLGIKVLYGGKEYKIVRDGYDAFGE
jgi:thiamine-monophosphate kinase